MQGVSRGHILCASQPARICAPHAVHALPGRHVQRGRRCALLQLHRRALGQRHSWRAGQWMPRGVPGLEVLGRARRHCLRRVRARHAPAAAWAGVLPTVCGRHVERCCGFSLRGVRRWDVERGCVAIVLGVRARSLPQREHARWLRRLWRRRDAAAEPHGVRAILPPGALLPVRAGARVRSGVLPG